MKTTDGYNEGSQCMFHGAIRNIIAKLPLLPFLSGPLLFGAIHYDNTSNITIKCSKSFSQPGVSIATPVQSLRVVSTVIRGSGVLHIIPHSTRSLGLLSPVGMHTILTSQQKLLYTWTITKHPGSIIFQVSSQ